MKWRDKNFGKRPQDPDFLDDYDPEEDYERYCEACEEREEKVDFNLDIIKDEKRTWCVQITRIWG